MRATAVACLATVACAFPMVLAGAVAVQMREELGFGAAALGVAIALFRGTSASTTALLGRVVDRVGAVTSLRVATVIAGTSCLGVATLAHDYATLLPWSVLGGLGIAIALPASNRLVVNAVPMARRGVAFGVKQSSLPAASMLAGLSVPLVALTLGWRVAYAGGVGLACLVLVLIGRRPSAAVVRAARAKPPALHDRRLLLLLAVAFGCGNFASSSMPAFYVDAAVAAGTRVEVAGSVLAAASVAAILVRLATGAVSDRIETGHLRLCAALLASGAFGLLLLTTGRPTPMALGVMLGMGGVWGVHGVFWFSLMRAYARTPGTASGFVATIGHAGGTTGPVIFGAIAQTRSYAGAWGVAGVLAVVSSAVMLLGSRELERTHPAGVDVVLREGNRA